MKRSKALRDYYDKERDWFVELAQILYVGWQYKMRSNPGAKISREDLKELVYEYLQDFRTWCAFVRKLAGYEPHAFEEYTAAIVDMIVDENYDKIVI